MGHTSGFQRFNRFSGYLAHSSFHTNTWISSSVLGFRFSIFSVRIKLYPPVALNRIQDNHILPSSSFLSHKVLNTSFMLFNIHRAIRWFVYSWVSYTINNLCLSMNLSILSNSSNMLSLKFSEYFFIIFISLKSLEQFVFSLLSILLGPLLKNMNIEK